MIQSPKHIPKDSKKDHVRKGDCEERVLAQFRKILSYSLLSLEKIAVSPKS